MNSDFGSCLVVRCMIADVDQAIRIGDEAIRTLLQVIRIIVAESIFTRHIQVQDAGCEWKPVGFTHQNHYLFTFLNEDTCRIGQQVMCLAQFVFFLVEIWMRMSLVGVDTELRRVVVVHHIESHVAEQRVFTRINLFFGDARF